MPKVNLSRDEALALAEQYGIDATKLDWQKIMQIIAAILALFAQPKQTLAAAGCPGSHEDCAACCLQCASTNLMVAQDLIACAADCCPPAPTP